jgi:anti-sigma-K factor RskA
VHIAHLFWPSDRKLFRQRSRWRVMVPAVAVMAVLALAITFGPIGWS